jgi:hypothetical protein
MEQDRRDPPGAPYRDAASDDSSRAAEHARNAAENRDALEAQLERTEATTSDEAGRPVGGMHSEPDTLRAAGSDRAASAAGMDADPTLSGGMRAEAARGSSEDTSEAEANVREAQRNRDALEAQSRRVEGTPPPDARAG